MHNIHKSSKAEISGFTLWGFACFYHVKNNTNPTHSLFLFRYIRNLFLISKKVWSNHHRYSNMEATSSLLLQLLVLKLLGNTKQKIRYIRSGAFPCYQLRCLFLLTSLSSSNSINKNYVTNLLHYFCFSASWSTINMLKHDTFTLFVQKSCM